MSYKSPTIDYDDRQSAYWDSQLFVDGTIQNAVTDPNLLGGTAMSVIFTRSTPAGTIEDQAQFQVHYVMRPGVAGVSDQLNSSDMTAVEADWKTRVWGVLKGVMTTGWVNSEIVWRDFGADFPLTTPDDPVANPPTHKYGPAKKRTAYSESGFVATARLPDQVAATITFRTASRRHWGRCYQGGFASPDLAGANTGRINPTIIDSITTAWDAHFSAIAGFSRQIEPVVWSARYAAIMSIDELVMDDVFDVVRRRRAKMASYRKVFS